MKILYQGKEVGLPGKHKKIIDMFGDNIRMSPKHIIACKVNNEVKSLEYTAKEGDNVELLDITTKDGMMVYVRGLLYIMSKAFDELYPHKDIIINYQLQNAMFCELPDGEKVTAEMVKDVKERMQEIIDEDYTIERKELTKAEAKKFYDNDKSGDYRGILQIHNKEKEKVTLYFCDDYYNYFYGVLPLSTGYCDIFDLKKYKHGFVIRYPERTEPGKLGTFKDSKKFSATLEEYVEIHKQIGVNNVLELNEKIRNGEAKHLVLLAEALQEKKIAELADEIAKNKSIKMVLIAGPSSSGKTTFAKRLGLQLTLNGINPVTIGTDDYFVERQFTPRDENGDFDFETIDALDLDLFNRNLTDLIAGKKVNIPTFDFKTGHKHYDQNKMMQLGENDVLVIEGIHCLNDRLTSAIAKENKFKIYISDLTVLNIDPYNRISTTDTRLIRRIVRDYNFRGYSAKETLSRWPSVNAGENKNIFPYQEEADRMFNSSLVYELAALGKYAKPLLNEITNDVPEYSEAKRLVSMLEYFEEIDESLIPNTSLLREFIGGGIFDY